MIAESTSHSKVDTMILEEAWVLFSSLCSHFWLWCWAMSKDEGWPNGHFFLHAQWHESDKRDVFHNPSLRIFCITSKRVFDIAHSGGEWQSTAEGGQCTLKLIGMNVKLVAFSMKTRSCSCNPPVSSSLHRAFLSKSWDVAMQDYSLFFVMQIIFVPTVFVYSILHLCIVLFASLRIPCTRWTVSLENVANAGSVRNTGLSDGQLETSLDFIRLIRCTADRDENHQHHRAWFLVQSCPKSGTKVVWGCKEKQGSPWVRIHKRHERDFISQSLILVCVWFMQFDFCIVEVEIQLYMIICTYMYKLYINYKYVSKWYLCICDLPFAIYLGSLRL